MHINKHDLNALLLCSFRYAKYRKSYIPAIIEECILKYGSNLTTATLMAIERDLINAELDSDNNNYEWAELKEFIKGRLNESK